MTGHRSALRARRGRSTLLGRASRASNQAQVDRGFSMFEVLASMVLAVLAITTVSLIAVSTNKSQRQSQAFDSGTQAANGVIEVARSLQWKSVGFATSQTGYRSSDLAGKPTVTVGTAIPALAPLVNQTAKGALCVAGTTGCWTVRTDIVWLQQPSAASPPVLGKMQIQVTATSVDLANPVVATVARAQTAAEAFATTPPPTLALASAAGGYQTRLTWTAPGTRAVLQLQRSATPDFASPVVIASPDLNADHGLFYDVSPNPGAFNYYRVHTTVAAGGLSDSPTAQLYAPPALSLPTMPGAGSVTWDQLDTPDTTSATLQRGTVATGFTTPVETVVPVTASSAPITFALNDTAIYRLKLGVADGSIVYSNTVTSVSIPTPVLTLGTVDNVSGTAAVKWNIPPSKFGVPRAGLVLGAVGSVPVSDIQSTTATTGTVSLTNPSAPAGRNVDTPITLVLEAADGTILGQSNAVTVNFTQINFQATPDNLNVAMGLNLDNAPQALGATAVTLERSDNAGFVGAPVALPIDLSSTAVIDGSAARGTPYWYRLTLTGADPTDTTPVVIGPVSVQAIPVMTVLSRPGTSTGIVSWDAGQVTSFGAAQVWVDSSTTADFSTAVTSVQITSPTQASVATPAYATGNAYTRIRFITAGTEVDSPTAAFLSPIVPGARQVSYLPLLNTASYEMDRSPSFYGWTGATITATFTGSPGSTSATWPASGVAGYSTPLPWVSRYGTFTTQTVTLDANTKRFQLALPQWPADLTYTITSTGPGAPTDTYSPVSTPDSFRSTSTCTAPCMISTAPATNPDDPTGTWDGNPPPFPGIAPEAYWSNSAHALRTDFTTSDATPVSGTSIVYISPAGTVQICTRVTSADGLTTTRPCGDLGAGQAHSGSTGPITTLALESDGDIISRRADGAWMWETQTRNSPIGTGAVYQLTFEGNDSDITNGGILRLYRSVAPGLNATLLWDSVNGRAW